MTGKSSPVRGRLNGTGPIAVIDIGSNSVRMVVYERKARTPTMLFNEKILAGLGRGVAATGRLSEESVIPALKELARFKALSEHIGCRKLMSSQRRRRATQGTAPNSSPRWKT
jgi:exopolyphosphatase/guanosine-5'-triphosphate,3'-diphosphate pyrophosphatase